MASFRVASGRGSLSCSVTRRRTSARDRLYFRCCFCFSSRRRHTRFDCDWSSDVCSSDLIRSKLAFEIYARRHARRTLRAGEYFFDHPMTGRDVFWKIVSGQIYEQPFTVREGETIFDIARDLQAGKFMPAGDFLRSEEHTAELQS